MWFNVTERCSSSSLVFGTGNRSSRLRKLIRSALRIIRSTGCKERFTSRNPPSIAPPIRTVNPPIRTINHECSASCVGASAEPSSTTRRLPFHILLSATTNRTVPSVALRRPKDSPSGFVAAAGGISLGSKPWSRGAPAMYFTCPSTVNLVNRLFTSGAKWFLISFPTRLQSGGYRSTMSATCRTRLASASRSLASR